MAKNGQILIIGAIGLAAVYLITRKQSIPPSYTPPAQLPSPQQQQQQLLTWAQNQSAGSTIIDIVKNMDWSGIADMWGKIFGSGSSNSSSDYSGGGYDSPNNPYQSYDPYGSGEIYV